jgi:hypothetical protein
MHLLLVSVVYQLSFVFVIINWLSRAGSSGRLSDVINYFFYKCVIWFCILSCEADTASSVLQQMLLQMMCANIFAGLLCAGHICTLHKLYWLFLQVPPHVQTDITRERVTLQHRGVQSQQGAYIQLQLAVTYLLQGAWCATLPDHRSTWLHIHWQGDTVNIALWLLVLLLDA